MRKRYRQCAIWQQISRSYYNIGVFISRNSRKKIGEDAGNFLAKKSSFHWQMEGGGLHLHYQHRPEPPLMCSTEGC